MSVPAWLALLLLITNWNEGVSAVRCDNHGCLMHAYAGRCRDEHSLSDFNVARAGFLECKGGKEEKKYAQRSQGCGRDNVSMLLPVL